MPRNYDFLKYVGIGFFALSIGFFYNGFGYSHKVKEEEIRSDNHIEIIETREVGNESLDVLGGLSALLGIGCYTVGCFDDKRE